MNTRNGNKKMTRPAAMALGAVACLGSVIALGGCRGDRTAERPRQFFPDMDDQPKYKAQSESPVYADGRAMRPLVKGVVGFGPSTDPNDPDRRWLDVSNDAVALGINPDGSYLEFIPMNAIINGESAGGVSAADAQQFIMNGRDQFNIFCMPCHGSAGDGKGVVGQRWAAPLPSFHDDRFQRGGANSQDGYVFHTIRNGLPNVAGAMPEMKMPAYGDRVSIEEAWSIVAYIRALQKTQSGELRDVPESNRDTLLSSRSAAINNTAPEGATP